MNKQLIITLATLVAAAITAQAQDRSHEIRDARELATYRNSLPGYAQAARFPSPDYPYEARSRHIPGRGVFVLLADRQTGKVVKIVMEESTGNRMLDAAARAAFGKWRLPIGWTGVRMPITFGKMDKDGAQ
jgi:TonB family protein